MNAEEPTGPAPEPSRPVELDPLPGEQGAPDVSAPRRFSFSRKGLLAAGTMALGLAGVVGFSIARFAQSGKEAHLPKLGVSQTPAAANTEPRRLDVNVPPAPAPAASNPPGPAPANAPRIPAIEPEQGDAQPIPVRRTGSGSPSGNGRPAPSPLDAPVMLVTAKPHGVTHAEPADAAEETGSAAGGPLAETQRNLQGYRQQLGGLLERLGRTAKAAGAPQDAGASASGMTGLGGPGLLPPAGAGAGGSLFGGTLQSSATPKVAAATLGNRSLTLPKGTAFTCALKTKVISASSGLVGCQVQRNVYGDDGRVLLIERGSHLDGEYRVASVKPGTVRIPVLWTRIRTPLGVTVDLDSPGTGPLGESGMPGYVDNRWGERLGAAMLLSLIDDAVQVVISNQQSGTNADTVVLPGTTASTSKLAEKVLDSTINIPPLIYQNQGGLVGIVVARDVDFSSVYELQPTEVAR